MLIETPLLLIMAVASLEPVCAVYFLAIYAGCCGGFGARLGGDDGHWGLFLIYNILLLVRSDDLVDDSLVISLSTNDSLLGK